MSQITVKLDPTLPNWHMDVGSSFFEELQSSIMVKHVKSNDAPPSLTGISFTERMTFDPWEVRAGTALYMSLMRNRVAGWRFE